MRTDERPIASRAVVGVGVFAALSVCVTALLIAAASAGSVLGVLTGTVLLGLVLMLGGQLLVDALLRRRHRIEETIRSARRRL